MNPPDISIPTKRTAFTAVLQNGPIIQNVFMEIDLLCDMLTLRDCNRALQTTGSRLVQQWWESIVQPFVGVHIPEFRDIMQVSGTVITGSRAVTMLTGEETGTTNLNLVVTHGNCDILYSFLLNDLCYHRTEEGRPPHDSFKRAVKTFAKFRRAQHVISVSEATADGVLRVILSGQTTADMLCMSAGGLVCLYPQLTVDQHIALMNHTAQWHAPTHNVGCRKHLHLTMRSSTSFLNGPCGSLCPTLWRKVADHGQQTLTLQWDLLFLMKMIIDNSPVIWCLALRCRNWQGVTNRGDHEGRHFLPPHCVPSTHASIKQEERRIEGHIPPYEGTFIGILYATRATVPWLVTIPVRQGPELHFSVSSRFHKTYNPRGKHYYSYAYTFFREHPMAASPPNYCICNAAGISDEEDDVTGNVLVITALCTKDGSGEKISFN
ncbi:hypothetical protein BDR05DRAFT_1002617 [Suillus weaverae]|nr:hypothetical protein BDR05DRAFT_1002617 [Suillus weaverae]